MIRMVVSDFDNTLLNYCGGKKFFDDYQLDVLKRLKEKKIVFAIITGRSVAFFSRFPKLMEVVDYIFASNGGVLYRVSDGKFMCAQLIKNDDLKRITDYAVKGEYNFILNSFKTRYQWGKWNEDVENLFDDKENYNCEQIVLEFPKRERDNCFTFLSNIKGICVNRATVFGNVISIDINDIMVSKGKAVVILCQKLGISLHDVVGFGDGDNDLSLLEVVGTSVAVGNASDKIQKYVNYITYNCEDNGVFRYIEDNILR